MSEIKNFAEARVGDEAYTWELENGDFGDYRFETAVDPRDVYDRLDEVVIRKRWRLVEVERLEPESPDDDEEEDE